MQQKHNKYTVIKKDKMSEVITTFNHILDFLLNFLINLNSVDTT